MTREHRIAIARIISDIIRADNIIEESEIKLLHEYMKSYGIKRSHMEEARRMRFSDAVVTLQEADEKELGRFQTEVQSFEMRIRVGRR